MCLLWVNELQLLLAGLAGALVQQLLLLLL